MSTTQFRMPENVSTDRRTLLRGGLALLGAGAASTLAPQVAGAAPTGGAGLATATSYLKRGSYGSAVTTLQKNLNASGYWCGTPDGSFGHLTQQAVYALQKRHGLVRDGIYGPASGSALATGSRLAPVGGAGTRIEVHLRRQLLLVVKDGRTTRMINTSTGNGEYYWLNGRRYRATTPAGSYSVYSTYGSGWQWGPLGSLYRPMYFNGGIGVHGANDIPPVPASHGCCRVSTAAMDLLWSTGEMKMSRKVLVV